MPLSPAAGRSFLHSPDACLAVTVQKEGPHWHGGQQLLGHVILKAPVCPLLPEQGLPLPNPPSEAKRAVAMLPSPSRNLPSLPSHTKQTFKAQ